MRYKEIRKSILSRLEDGLTIDVLIAEDGFTKELKYLEDSGYVESTSKPDPKNSIYSTYVITKFGRDYLETIS